MNPVRRGLSDNNIRRLIALAALGMLGALTVYGVNHSETGEVSRRVTRIEAKSPCLAYPHSKLCRRSFSAAIRTVTPAQVCTLFALVNVTPAECQKIQHRREAREVEALPTIPEAEPAEASPAPEHAPHPVLAPPTGQAPPPTGAPNPGPKPSEQTPPIPELSGPSTPQGEGGPSPEAPAAAEPTPPTLIETIGGLVCEVSGGVALCL